MERPSVSMDDNGFDEMLFGHFSSQDYQDDYLSDASDDAILFDHFDVEPTLQHSPISIATATQDELAEQNDQVQTSHAKASYTAAGKRCQVDARCSPRDRYYMAFLHP